MKQLGLLSIVLHVRESLPLKILLWELNINVHAIGDLSILDVILVWNYLLFQEGRIIRILKLSAKDVKISFDTSCVAVANLVSIILLKMKVEFSCARIQSAQNQVMEHKDP